MIFSYLVFDYLQPWNVVSYPFKDFVYRLILTFPFIRLTFLEFRLWFFLNRLTFPSIRLWILSNRLTLLAFRLNGKTNRLNACVNRLPTVYNPFIFTRLTENR